MEESQDGRAPPSTFSVKVAGVTGAAEIMLRPRATCVLALACCARCQQGRYDQRNADAQKNALVQKGDQPPLECSAPPLAPRLVGALEARCP